MPCACRAHGRMHTCGRVHSVHGATRSYSPACGWRSAASRPDRARRSSAARARASAAATATPVRAPAHVRGCTWMRARGGGCMRERAVHVYLQRALEARAALAERQRREVLAVEPHDVEDDVAPVCACRAHAIHVRGCTWVCTHGVHVRRRRSTAACCPSAAAGSRRASGCRQRPRSRPCPCSTPVRAARVPGT